MDKDYILKLLSKKGLDHIDLKIITGEKVSVSKIEEDNSENELIEVLEPTKITVNLKYVVTIEEIYPPDFEALNELSF
ncbi:hypothetical protein SSCHL_0864 [Staphylococcus schleiferi]|uniref:Uncharacterized protein n=1 Tax=Staphylococcus coagulans TaxID=74706 RepID=A0ABU1F0L6_9STAP|nr:hypothetical protein [Staphylococcus coagulans]MDR5603920.1 hypothetical protein [Staphylococcus coagulans]BAS45644.1 hypothetical protein SSCHL_0864 [Staphylococcus schleiferi]